MWDSVYTDGVDYPIAIFNFKYRSEKDLRATLLLSKSPSPERRVRSAAPTPAPIPMPPRTPAKVSGAADVGRVSDAGRGSDVYGAADVGEAADVVLDRAAIKSLTPAKRQELHEFMARLLVRPTPKSKTLKMLTSY